MVGAALLLFSGCGTVALRHSFNDYSAIYAETQNRQMLLNLARLHDREPIYFFQLAQISAGYTFTETMGLGDGKSVGLPNSTTANYHLANGTLGGTATHNPVFTLVPLGGDKFAQQLLAPIKPGIFYELFEEGWPIDLLMRVLIERIELVKDDAEAKPSGDANERLEIMVNDPLECRGGHYDRFLRACALARQFQKSGILYLDISDNFEPLAPVAYKDQPTDQQQLNANKDGLVWRQIPREAAVLPGYWQLGRKVKQTLFKLNEARMLDARDDIAANNGDFRGNDNLMAKFQLVLKTGIGVTDTNTSKNAYQVRLVMRSLIGAMLALANEQRNFGYFEAYQDQVRSEGLAETIDRARNDLASEGTPEAMSEEAKKARAVKMRNLTALIDRSVDAVPEFERHPVLILNWPGQGARAPAPPLDPATIVASLDYKGEHFAVGDRSGSEDPLLDTWNRDVFRLLVQLSLQVSADPSTFALPSLLQSH